MWGGSGAAHWRLCGGILNETQLRYTQETPRGETVCAPAFSVVFLLLQNEEKMSLKSKKTKNEFILASADFIKGVFQGKNQHPD